MSKGMAGVNESGGPDRDLQAGSLQAETIREMEPRFLDPRLRSSRDGEIRLAVMEALYWDLAIPQHRVTVEVEDGWVALKGCVERAYSRHRAEWAARGVHGVVGVTNAIVTDQRL